VNAADLPLLRVQDVAITHDGAAAATPSGVRFEVRPGEVVLVLGPSGSGKSTLALALNGLIPHDLPADVAGVVEVAGQDAAHTSVAQLSRSVAMVFQDPDAQLVTSSVQDEVAFGPENLLVPADEVLARAEEALRHVGLWERRDDEPERLSGGGRQRLAVAAALAMHSPLLVLDEPTANLDPRGIEEVYAALAEVVAERRRAIVLIEHNLDAAMALVDRVVVLDRDGRLFADGPADVVLRTQAQALFEMGVWLPASTLAALRLRAAGYVLDPLPLTPAALADALARTPAPLARERSPQRSADAATHRSALRGEEAAVSVRGLTLTRGKRTVLHDVRVEIGRGEFVAVIGENGAGKSSLVQAIGGVMTVPRGTVFVDGRDVRRTPPPRLAERVGFVFQNPEHQFIAHTVFDEMAHGLRRRRLPDAEVTTRTWAMLERFGLAGAADAHPFLLSGGQKRRLSVGTALVGGARILVLDEPTFGQDRARADEVLRLLRELNDAGTTIIVVSHDMQLVSEHADRTLVLSRGELVAARPTAEVFADDDLLSRAGLRPPPLVRALRDLPGHPELAGVTRLSDLPGADA
jgi:energy-coupling factor transport system ATP-binding protein